MSTVTFNSNQPSSLPQSNPHQDINQKLLQASMATWNRLPNAELISYAGELFGLYTMTSLSVKEKILELAGANVANHKDHLNFAKLNPKDLACVYQILDSFQKNFELKYNPYNQTFGLILPCLKDYMVFLCGDNRGRDVLDALISYKDPALEDIIQGLRNALTSPPMKTDKHESTTNNTIPAVDEITELEKKIKLAEEAASKAWEKVEDKQPLAEARAKLNNMQTQALVDFKTSMDAKTAQQDEERKKTSNEKAQKLKAMQEKLIQEFNALNKS